MFSLIFTAGTFFYKQSLLTHTGDEYLRAAANKGKFTAEELEQMINKLDKLGFSKEKTEIEITPASALEKGVSKDSDEYIRLTINPNKKALISTIFDLMTPGDNTIKYYYSRIAKSEEYID